MFLMFFHKSISGIYTCKKYLLSISFSLLTNQKKENVMSNNYYKCEHEF